MRHESADLREWSAHPGNDSPKARPLGSDQLHETAGVLPDELKTLPIVKAVPGQFVSGVGMKLVFRRGKRSPTVGAGIVANPKRQSSVQRERNEVMEESRIPDP